MKKSSKILKANLKDYKTKKYKLSPLSKSIEIFMNTTKRTALEYVFVFDRVVSMNKMEFIDVSCFKHSDNKYYHHFQLNEISFEDQFHVLFDDIINYISNFDEVDEVTNAFQYRFTQWVILLQKGTVKRMSIKFVKGLIGELIILENLLEYNDDHLMVLNGWKGPYKGHKDYVYDDIWFEVKCVHNNAKKVEISSFEQLESNITGILSIVTLTESQPYMFKLSVSESINRIKQKLKKVEHKLLFLKILSKTSIIFGDELCDKDFYIKSIKYYEISDAFPKIRRDEIASEISDGSYSLIIRLLNTYLVEENKLWD